jgi:hypothetical protein
VAILGDVCSHAAVFRNHPLHTPPPLLGPCLQPARVLLCASTFQLWVSRGWARRGALT